MKRTELTVGLASLMALGLCACASTGESGTAAAQAQPATYESAVEDNARRNNAHVRWVNPPQAPQSSDTTRSPSVERSADYGARVEQAAREQGAHTRWVNPPQASGDDDE